MGRARISVLVGEAPVIDEMSLARLLPGIADIVIAGAARNADELESLAGEVDWNLALADLNTLRGACVPVLGALRSAWPDRRILALCADDSRVALRAVLSAGVDGCVVRTATVTALAQIVGRVAAGQAHFDDVIATVFREPDPPDDGYAVVDPDAWHLMDDAPAGEDEPLTRRERDIVGMVAVGWGNKTIASRLGISLPTVRKHRENLMRKLGLHNAAEVTAYAIGHGLVPRD